jgi:hypothetical protein
MPASKGYTEISRALARQGIKTSPAAIKKAHDTGRIKPRPDGSWDIESVIRGLADNRQRLRIDGPDYDNTGMTGLPAGKDEGTSWRAARTARELLDVQARKLKIEQTRGNLISRSKVLNEVEGLASELRDHWLNFAARNAALIAAEIQADPDLVQRVLDRYVVEHARRLPEADIDPRI